MNKKPKVRIVSSPLPPSRTATISRSAWEELLAALHPADRRIGMHEGEQSIVIRSGLSFVHVLKENRI